MKVVCTCPHQDTKEPLHDKKCPTSLRNAFDACVVRLAEISLDSGDRVEDYTPDQLEEMAHYLTLGLAKLRTLPGGQEAVERHYALVEAEARRRGIIK